MGKIKSLFAVFHLYLVANLLLLSASNSINPLTVEYKWKDLTEEELKQWYTETDLCALKWNEYQGFPQNIRAKNCSKFSSMTLLRLQSY